jgi:uncharacterized RDD family membrane protein YckC
VVTRFVAAGVDVAVVAVAMVAGYLGLAGVRFMIDPRDFSFPDPDLGPALVVLAVLTWTYLTIAWAAGGWTYGNRLMGLRVVTLRADRVGWVRSGARAVAYVVLPIGLVWAAVDRRSRSVQDLVLRTAVVYDWRPRATRSRVVTATAQFPSVEP